MNSNGQRVITRAVTLLALTVTAVPGSAQLPNLPTLGPSWVDLSYPKVFYTSRDGLTFGLYYAQIRQLDYSDFDAPPPYRGLLSIDGQLSTSGSRQVTFHVRFPRMIDGWRFGLSIGAQRHAKENYFGIGNRSTFDDNLVSTQPDFYKADHRRHFARGEVQRRVVGGLRILAGFHIERWRLDTLDGTSQLASDALAGADPTIANNTDDISARIGLVFDTRNDEVASRRGVLLEAIYGQAAASAAGDLSYTRATISAAGYLPVGERLLLTARVVGQSMAGAPRLGSYYLIEASDRPYTGLGGAYSHRALLDNRLLGEDKLFGNLDVRYDLTALPTLYRVTLVAFLDAGRVFQREENEDFRLTTDDLEVGGGLGLIVQLFRAAIMGGSAAVGPDGVTLNAYTRWAY